jgi:hypothetical protein
MTAELSQGIISGVSDEVRSNEPYPFPIASVCKTASYC